MPTESDFLAAARLFDSAGDEVSDVPGLVASAFGPDVATGGQLTLEIEALIRQTTAACSADAATLVDLAATCRERAQIVADYAAAMNGWGYAMRNHAYAENRWYLDLREWEEDPLNQRHPGSRPTAPRKPAKPAAWVEI